MPNGTLSTNLCTLMQIRDLKASEGSLKALRVHSQSAQWICALLCRFEISKLPEGSLKALRVHSQSAQRIYALLWGFETSRLPEGTLKALSKCSHIYTLSWGFEVSRLPRAVSKLAHNTDNTLKLLNGSMHSYAHSKSQGFPRARAMTGSAR